MKVAMTEISIDGLTGKGISWQSNGEPNKSPMVVQIKDGVYTLLEN